MTEIEKLQAEIASLKEQIKRLEDKKRIKYGNGRVQIKEWRKKGEPASFYKLWIGWYADCRRENFGEPAEENYSWKEVEETQSMDVMKKTVKQLIDDLQTIYDQL